MLTIFQLRRFAASRVGQFSSDPIVDLAMRLHRAIHPRERGNRPTKIVLSTSCQVVGRCRFCGARESYCPKWPPTVRWNDFCDGHDGCARTWLAQLTGNRKLQAAIEAAAAVGTVTPGLLGLLETV